MAHGYKCHGPQCPYGYGHHDEHVAAAKLGWERRRHGQARYDGSWKGYEAHRHDGGLFGADSHFILRNAETGEHYEVPRRSYEARHAAAQHAAQHAGQHAALQERLTDREVQRRNRKGEQEAAIAAARAAAQAKKDAAAKKKQDRFEARGAAVLARLEKGWAIAQAKLDKKLARQAERDARDLEKERAAQDRYVRLYERTELYQYLSGVTISPYRNDPSLNREMYSRVPYKFRHKKGTRNSEGRLTRGEYLDELAATMAEEAPWLGITNDEELVQAFDRVKEAGRRKGFVAGRRMNPRGRSAPL